MPGKGRVHMARGVDKGTKYVHRLSHLADGIMYETVISEGSAVFVACRDGEEPVEVDFHGLTEFINDELVYLLPLSDPIVMGKNGKAGMLKVSGPPVAYEDATVLAYMVRDFIHDYLDVSEINEWICTYYVLMTWLFGPQHEIPYLCFRGDYSAGKTRALKTVGHLCYHSILTSSITTAALYYMADMYSPTLLIDEFNLKFSDKDDDIVRMLNSGYSRDTCAIRMVGEGTKRPEAYDVFCPKIIANKTPFEDPALESRCLVIDMLPTERDDIPSSLPGEFFERQVRLRDMLLQFRFDWYWRLDWDASSKMNEPKMRKYPHRLRQVMAGFKGLFECIPWAEGYLDEYMASYNREQLRQRQDSKSGRIVYALLSLAASDLKGQYGLETGLEYVYITSSNIAEHYMSLFGEQVSAVQVGKEVRALKIDVELTRRNGRVIRRLSLKHEALMALQERYILHEEWIYCATEATGATGATEAVGPMGISKSGSVKGVEEGAPPSVTNRYKCCTVTEEDTLIDDEIQVPCRGCEKVENVDDMARIGGYYYCFECAREKEAEFKKRQAGVKG